MRNGLRLRVAFFKTEMGREPVREWLLSLSRAERQVIGTDLLDVQYGWPVGMPLVRKLATDLWEVRSDLDDRIARVLFTIEETTLVALHGFIKKSQQTPKGDLDLAKKRFPTPYDGEEHEKPPYWEHP
jgi:phage-related protein